MTKFAHKIKQLYIVPNQTDVAQLAYRKKAL